MIPQKTFEKNYTIELVQRLFRRLYAKDIQSRTTDAAYAVPVRLTLCGKLNDAEISDSKVS